MEKSNDWKYRVNGFRKIIKIANNKELQVKMDYDF